jgi:acyl-CoA thioesterase-2
MPTKPLNQLLRLLDLEQIEVNLFRAQHPPERRERLSRRRERLSRSGERLSKSGERLYGGQIIAQALMAAARSAPADRFVHSLHGYFLRPGDPSVAALIEVESIRDGASFTTRRVVVRQQGRAIFNMDASMQVIEDGLSHQANMPKGLTPPSPADIPVGFADRPFISWRYDHRLLSEDAPQPPQQKIWFKTNGLVPDNPLLHASLLVYESDNVLLGTARLPHRGSFKREIMQVASLDHAVWFHNKFRVDEWLLYCVESPSASNARGYSRGSIFTEDGRLVASTMQEGLIRNRV